MLGLQGSLDDHHASWLNLSIRLLLEAVGLNTATKGFVLMTLATDAALSVEGHGF